MQRWRNRVSNYLAQRFQIHNWPEAFAKVAKDDGFERIRSSPFESSPLSCYLSFTSFCCVSVRWANQTAATAAARLTTTGRTKEKMRKGSGERLAEETEKDVARWPKISSRSSRSSLVELRHQAADSRSIATAATSLAFWIAILEWWFMCIILFVGLLLHTYAAEQLRQSLWRESA